MREEKAERENERKATTIKIDPELWKATKIEAIKREIEVSELVEEAVRKEIKGGK